MNVARIEVAGAESAEDVTVMLVSGGTVCSSAESMDVAGVNTGASAS